MAAAPAHGTVKSFIALQIQKFASFASHTFKGARVNFPKKQSRIFCDELKAVTCTFGGPDQKVRALGLLLAFVTSVRTSVETLKGQEGIQAMCTFLNVFLTLLDVVCSQQDINSSLTWENVELKRKLSSLETQILIMQESEGVASPADRYTVNQSVVEQSLPWDRLPAGNHINVPEPAKTVGDVAVPDSLSELLLASMRLMSMDGVENAESSVDPASVEWLAGAIPIIGSRDIRILKTYMGRARNNLSTESCLVVLYRDQFIDDIGWMPPLHHGIHWQCVNRSETNDDFEVDNFAEFCKRDPAGFDNLIMDFFDQSCIKLLTENTGVTCIYPSARLGVDGKFEPCLVVGVVCVAFCAEDEAPIPGEIVTLGGRVVPLLVRDGLMLETCNSLSSGISAASQINDCGSLGGVVKDVTGSTFFLTCEHVLVGLEKALNTWDKVVELTIPSVQARKCFLSRAVAEPEAKSASTSPLDRIVHNSSSSELKRLLKKDESTEVLLQEVHTYLTEQYTFVSEADKWIKFGHRESMVDALPNMGQVRLNGDIGLIPVPSRFDQNLEFSHTSVLTLEAILQNMKRSREIAVHLHAAISGSPFRRNTHRLSNLIHTKGAFDQNDMEYRSPTLERILLGQYMIVGSDFGVPGDSGGLVYVESVTGEKRIVGIFVGSFNQEKTKFVASPAEVLLVDYTFLGCGAGAV
jgi:hypothetical protein